MRIVHVVGSFFPATSFGGPIESTRRLCAGIRDCEHEVTVLTTDADGPENLPPRWRGWREIEGVRVYYGHRIAGRDLSIGLHREIAHETAKTDIAHVTLAYNWFLPVVAKVCRRHGVPLVLSPRGTLLPRARRQKRVKKRLYDSLIQQDALAAVTAYHATSQEEAKELRSLFSRARIAVIPNGVDVPDMLPKRDPDLTPYILYLGRLHPYKRIERIIEAFGLVTGGERASAVGGPATARGMTESGVRWVLVVAGDGEARYRGGLEHTATNPRFQNRVQFVGHVSGEEKTRLLAQADFVVQAPNPENFGNVVAEALAHGRPVLVGKGLPWEALEREGCGLWVDDSEEALAEGMRRLMALSPEERRAMGARGREWMKRDFSWESVAKQMIELYESVIEEKKSADGRW